MIQYSVAPVIELIGPGVLDAALRGILAYATSDSFETLASTERLRPPALAA
jgi:hypothetical protein